MTTKRQEVPFSQNAFLWSTKQQRQVETTKTFVKTDGTVYSEEIFMPSAHGFAALMIQATYTEGVPNGGVALTIKASYKYPGTSNWSTGVQIAAETGGTGTEVLVYRLDAALALNWIPNTIIRFEFSIPSGQDADQVVLKGRYIV
jgi:hypothetical protein